MPEGIHKRFASAAIDPPSTGCAPSRELRESNFTLKPTISPYLPWIGAKGYRLLTAKPEGRALLLSSLFVISSCVFGGCVDSTRTRTVWCRVNGWRGRSQSPAPGGVGGYTKSPPAISPFLLAPFAKRDADHSPAIKSSAMLSDSCLRPPSIDSPSRGPVRGSSRSGAGRTKTEIHPTPRTWGENSQGF
jgi:hypothetical protein